MKVDLDTRPEHIRYLSAAGRVLLRTDRILAGRDDLGLTLAEFGPAPAWSDGTTVTLRTKDWVTSWEDAGSLARLLGLNYHELCHIVYTPRQHTNAFRAIEAAASIYHGQVHLLRVFNLADDQRIETLFTSLYAPSVAFFTQAVMDLILHDEADIGLTHLLVTGRRYLPRKLRRHAEAAFVGGPTLARRYADLMQEYLLVDWDLDAQDGIRILEALADIIDQVTPKAPEGCNTPAPTKGSADSDSGDEARERVAEDIEAEEAEAEQDEPEVDEDEQAAEAQAEPEANEVEAQADEPEADEAQGDEPEVDEPEVEPEANEGGSGTEQDEAEPEADLEQELRELAEQLAEAMGEQTRLETDRVGRQIELELDAPQGQMGDMLPRWAERIPVTDAARAAAHELESVISELRMLADPGWQSHEPTGVINPARYMHRESWEPMDEVFDRWSPGVEDALDIEIALLVDTSSSMGSTGNPGSPSHGVAEATWAIKRAMDAHRIPMAVMAFDSKTTLIYHEDDEADLLWMPKPLGRDGTEPAEALLEAGRHFNHSSHKRKILVVLTDGAIGSYQVLDHHNPVDTKVDTADLIQSIDVEVRILLGYSDSRSVYQPQVQGLGFDRAELISSTDQLVEAVRATIVDGVREALAS